MRKSFLQTLFVILILGAASAPHIAQADTFKECVKKCFQYEGLCIDKVMEKIGGHQMTGKQWDKAIEPCHDTSITCVGRCCPK